MEELTSSDIEVLRTQALGSLYFFARAVLGFNYLVPHVHGRVCSVLEAPARRKQFTLPRGFLKTTLCTVANALWRAVRNPDVRILIAMNSFDNAAKTIAQIRDIVENCTMFRVLFPDVVPDIKKVKWTDPAAELRRPGSFREATFEAAGVGTTIISRHYDIIIEDDLIAPKKDDLTGAEVMPTKEDIEKAIGWHKLARSLLVDPGLGEIVNVGTRWAKFDLIQHIIDNEPHTLRFELAAIDDNGQPTYPERFPLDVLRELEEEQGTYIFSSQYLNKPYDVSRMVFHPEWLQVWQGRDSLPKGMRVAMFVDPAISLKEDACFSAPVVVGASGGDLYVLDYRRGKMTPTQVIEAMFELAALWGVRDIYVEVVAYQEALRHFFELECKRRGLVFNVVPVRPGRSEAKEDRIRGLQPIAQRHSLFIAPWMRDLQRELLDFPFGKTVDILDAIAYAPRYLDLALSFAQARPRAVGFGVETVGDVVEKLRQRNARARFGPWGYRSKIERLA